VRVAVVHAPALGSTFWAVRGQGARGDGGPLAVSPTSSLGDAVFLINKAYAPAHLLWETTAGLLPEIRAARMLGCVSLDLALVAAGWADGAVLLPADPWDLSAGTLLVAEAGGRVTDLEGNSLPEGQRSAVLAAPPALHAPALAKLHP
jgi:myo-inositol-1(or 4)-monophosphatase